MYHFAGVIAFANSESCRQLAFDIFINLVAAIIYVYQRMNSIINYMEDNAILIYWLILIVKWILFTLYVFAMYCYIFWSIKAHYEETRYSDNVQ
jgi:hypothetical protein